MVRWLRRSYGGLRCPQSKGTRSGDGRDGEMPPGLQRPLGAAKCGVDILTLLGAALPALLGLLGGGGLDGGGRHLGRGLRVGGCDGRAHGHPLRAVGAVRLHTARQGSGAKRVRRAARGEMQCWWSRALLSQRRSAGSKLERVHAKCGCCRDSDGQAVGCGPAAWVCPSLAALDARHAGRGQRRRLQKVQTG